METYRVFFRCGAGVIVGRQDLLDADDDGAAVATASRLFDACCDVAAGFERWHGARLVATSYARRPPEVGDAGSINAETQASVARYEEMLLDSRWTIAKSQRLLALTRRSP
jgi:hypothetical protein